MSNNKIKSILIKTAKVILIVWGIAWALGNIASIFFSYQDLVTQSSQVLDTNSQTLSSTAFEEKSSNSIEVIFKASFKPFLILSTVSVILGVIVLYNGRTFLEMLYMFDFFMVPRQRKYWGTILDSHTRGPISLALITLKGVDSKKELRTVSDLDGRYRIRISDLKEKYIIEVKAEIYKPFTKEIDSSLGSIISRGEFIEDIVLYRADDVTSTFNSNLAKIRSKLYAPLIIYLSLLSFFGFILYLNQSIIKPGVDSFLGAIFFGIASVWNIIIITERIRNRLGKIVDQNGKPIGGVVINLFNKDDKVDSLLSDENGIVKFQTETGIYKILVAKDGYELHNSKDGFIEVKINNDGYLTKDIVLEQTGEVSNTSSVLMNPFEDK